MKYKVGDRVVIVDRWNPDGACRQNNRGLMDKWLGKTMTIRSIWGGRYRMYEDEKEWKGDGWFWNEHCIKGLAEPEVEYAPVRSDDFIRHLITA